MFEILGGYALTLTISQREMELLSKGASLVLIGYWLGIREASGHGFVMLRRLRDQRLYVLFQQVAVGNELAGGVFNLPDEALPG